MTPFTFKLLDVQSTQQQHETLAITRHTHSTHAAHTQHTHSTHTRTHNKHTQSTWIDVYNKQLLNASHF